MTDLPWFAFLLVIGFYFCVCLEVLFPTAGLAGILAAVAIIAALVVSFTQSIGWGVGIACFVLITTPPLMITLVRIWPYTPMGRRILNRRPDQVLYQAPTAKTRQGKAFDSLIGHRGTALSDLLPSGLVMIDGERIDAISSGEAIDRGCEVIVVKIENRHLQVRLARIDDQTASPDSSNGDDQRTKHRANEEPTAAPESTAKPSSPPHSPPGLEISLDELDG